MNSQAEDATERIRQLEALRARYQGRFVGERGEKKLAQVVDYLISVPITTVTQAQEELSMGSYTTIQRYFRRLEALGIIREVTGKRRNRIYRADEIFSILAGRG